MQEERLKAWVRRRTPWAEAVLGPPYRLGRSALASCGPVVRLHRRLRPPRSVFAGLIEAGVWAAPGTVCGPASTVEATGPTRAGLEAAIARHSVRSLLDAPCGDWSWMQHVRLDGVEYTGLDIVPALIGANRQKFGRAGRDFRVADLRLDELPKADLVLCRDCLIHLPFDDARAVLRNFVRSGSSLLAATTYPATRRNTAIFTGQWYPVNLQAPPFNLPEPLEWLPEGDIFGRGKSLGLWRMEDVAGALR